MIAQFCILFQKIMNLIIEIVFIPSEIVIFDYKNLLKIKSEDLVFRLP